MMMKSGKRNLLLFCMENKKSAETLAHFNNKFLIDLRKRVLFTNNAIKKQKTDRCCYLKGNVICSFSSNFIVARKNGKTSRCCTIAKAFYSVGINKTVRVQTKEKSISFEHITRILKSLKKWNLNYDGKKSLEKKVDFLLPHIYEECEQNYIHFSCILHNFHKLRNNISREYKIKAYDKFSSIFIYNINLFTLKEITIILKCLLEEKQMDKENIVQFCTYKFIYIVSIDILHKRKNDPLFYAHFFSVLNHHFQEYAKDYCMFIKDGISTNNDMNYFYELICNLNETNKNVLIGYFKNKLSTFESNSFNLHDVSAFLHLLKSYNLRKGLPLYAFLSHVYVSCSFVEIIPIYFYQQLELNFLSYETYEKFKFVTKRKNGLCTFEKGNETGETDELAYEASEQRENSFIGSCKGQSEKKIDISSKREDGKADKFGNDNIVMGKNEIISYFANIGKNQWYSAFPRSTTLINSKDNKKNKHIRENVHSMAVIIYTSIKCKQRNKFVYILSNYLLLKYIDYINLIDLCNIFELFICDERILKKKNYDIIFGRIKNLIVNERDGKALAIFCISIMRLKKELRNHFNNYIISIYRIILYKKDRSKNIFSRENTVIFSNIANFLVDQKISCLFYLYYLDKYNNFLNLLTVQKNEKNSHYSSFSTIDMCDMLKTFIHILKIYEKNDYFALSQKTTHIHLNKSMMCMLHFFKDFCFVKILSENDNFLNNLYLTSTEYLKRVKILNRTCYILCLFLPLLKKLQRDGIINRTTGHIFYELFHSFRNDLYKNYEHVLLSSKGKTKQHVNIFNFMFMIDKEYAMMKPL
ncbi:conserved Plasmodium protein, unknown function [Plasmodium ovale curtisi]|uniref:Uncharacterized protein n=1 Tax=Plasmodium ovale curtisi TaxID=864141 RepID=A0A1A8WRB8_PLAOA|nr:conserved Plasmodium protein, unknown function [Plasmodium ovale curtisi]